MENPEEALNPEAETETAETSTPEEEQTTEGEQEETPQDSKKGYSARVRELANAKKAAEAKAASLEERLGELTRQLGDREPTQDIVKPEPIVKDGEELTAEEFEKRLEAREKRLLQRINFENQRERAINQISREASEVVRVYPQLDPDSDEYDPELSNDVTEAAEEYLKANPSGSLKGFVNRMMKPISRQVTREVAATKEEVTKQASQEAMRPSSAKPVDKKFEDLSIEEMEAKLGFASPT